MKGWDGVKRRRDCCESARMERSASRESESSGPDRGDRNVTRRDAGV